MADVKNLTVKVKAVVKKTVEDNNTPVYLVGEYINEKGDYSIVGIYSSELIAIKQCVGMLFFIMEIEIDSPGMGIYEYIPCWFPKLESKEEGSQRFKRHLEEKRHPFYKWKKKI